MPLVEITNQSKFYEMGKIHIFECLVGGYPLPKVEWAFKKCPDYPVCEKSFTQIPVIFYNTYMNYIILINKV